MVNLRHGDLIVDVNGNEVVKIKTTVSYLAALESSKSPPSNNSSSSSGLNGKQSNSSIEIFHGGPIQGEVNSEQILNCTNHHERLEASSSSVPKSSVLSPNGIRDNQSNVVAIGLRPCSNLGNIHGPYENTCDSNWKRYRNPPLVSPNTDSAYLSPDREEQFLYEQYYITNNNDLKWGCCSISILPSVLSANLSNGNQINLPTTETPEHTTDSTRDVVEPSSVKSDELSNSDLCPKPDKTQLVDSNHEENVCTSWEPNQISLEKSPCPDKNNASTLDVDKPSGVKSLKLSNFVSPSHQFCARPSFSKDLCQEPNIIPSVVSEHEENLRTSREPNQILLELEKPSCPDKNNVSTLDDVEPSSMDRLELSNFDICPKSDKIQLQDSEQEENNNNSWEPYQTLCEISPCPDKTNVPTLDVDEPFSGDSLELSNFVSPSQQLRSSPSFLKDLCPKPDKILLVDSDHEENNNLCTSWEPNQTSHDKSSCKDTNNVSTLDVDEPCSMKSLEVSNFQSQSNQLCASPSFAKDLSCPKPDKILLLDSEHEENNNLCTSLEPNQTSRDKSPCRDTNNVSTLDVDEPCSMKSLEVSNFQSQSNQLCASPSFSKDLSVLDIPCAHKNRSHTESNIPPKEEIGSRTVSSPAVHHAQSDQNSVPSYEVPWVSTDVSENRDNNDPMWASLRNLRTDEERYKVVKNRWKQLEVPNPRVDLTKHNFKSQGLSMSSACGKSLKRNRSFDENENEHPSKRRRMVSCTDLFRNQIQSLEKEIDDETMFLQSQHEIELAKLRAHQQKESISNRYAPNYKRMKLNYEHNSELNNLAYEYQSSIEEMCRKKRRTITLLERASEEVLAFNKFYTDLGRNEDLCTISEEEAQQFHQTEAMYEMYKQIYTG